MHRGQRLKLAEWGRAGLKRPRLTRMSVAVLAALVLAVTAAGTAAALTTSSSGSSASGSSLAGSSLAGQARLPVAYNGLDGWQHGRVRLPVIYVGGSTAFLRIKHWSNWSAVSAATGGTLWVDNCRPDCASGHFRTYPAQITLSRVADRKGVRFFSRMRLRYAHGGPREYRYRWATYPGATVPLWVGGPS